MLPTSSGGTSLSTVSQNPTATIRQKTASRVPLSAPSIAKLKTSTGNSHPPRCGNAERIPETPGQTPLSLPLLLTINYIYLQSEKSPRVTWAHLGCKDY